MFLRLVNVVIVLYCQMPVNCMNCLLREVDSICDELNDVCILDEFTYTLH